MKLRLLTRKEDIKLVEDSKKWILSPERKVSKREKQYALDRLDGVVKKIEYAITKTILKNEKQIIETGKQKYHGSRNKKRSKTIYIKKII